MLTITTTQIRDAIVAKLADLVPTFEPLGSVLWSYTPSPRRGTTAQLQGATRNYDLVFGVGQPLYRTNPSASWVGGGGSACAYGCRLAIAVHYCGIDPDLLDHAITADAIDLHRCLRQLRDPTLPGFSNAEPSGTSSEARDGEGDLYVEHIFTIHWNQATTPA